MFPVLARILINLKRWNNTSVSPEEMFWNAAFLFKFGMLLEQIEDEHNEEVIGSALKLIEKIKDPYWKVEALASVYVTLSSYGKQGKTSIFKEAISVSKQIDNSFLKAKAISCLASAISKNDHKVSLKLTEEAIYIAESIQDESEKQLAIFNVAKIIAPIKTELAWNVLTKAIDHSNKNNQFYKNQAISSVLREFSKANPSLSIELISLMNDKYMKDLDLVFVLKTLIPFDQNRAIELAEKIHYSSEKSEAFYEIAKYIFKKNFKFSFGLWLIEKTEDPYWKNKIAIYVTNLFLERKNHHNWKKNHLLAEKFIGIAIKSANNLYPFEKAKTLSEISFVLSKMETIRAIDIAEEALKNANLVDSPSLKSTALCNVAEAFFNLHFANRSLEILELALDEAFKIKDGIVKNIDILLIVKFICARYVQFDVFTKQENIEKF